MTDSLTLSLHRSIGELDAHDWDRCAGDENPFVSHAFLGCVEDSGSTGRRTGWLPQHLALRDRGGRLVAVAPMYVKGHSYGEYVFDHSWAHAMERAGGRYYPKLLVASPFSPVPGPRLLRAADAEVDVASMAGALRQACEVLDLSSVHINFCQADEWEALGSAGWLQRLGMQFHWTNDGYTDFDSFLVALNSRKRKSIRRERRDAQAAGLDFLSLRGHEIKKEDWRAFYQFYLSTVDRKWGSAYLTERFFQMLSDRLGDRVVLMLARRGSEAVAGALNLIGRDALYGRNWGCLGDWPFLHFELCYYRAIDFAISEGLSRVEAGAQGEHKIQRGYLPVPTYSAHWIRHPGLRQAVGQALAEERPACLAEIEALSALSPFRQGEP
jgi:predicted N-acyltransferase